MRILHLSDTHLYDPARPRHERLHYGRIDPLAAFDAVCERAAKLAGIDAIVHSGDSSEDGSVGSYRALMERLDRLAGALGTHARGPIPVAVAMGNHDDPAAFAEVAGWGKNLGRGRLGQRFQDRVIDVPGHGRIVVLDTSVPRAGWGELEQVQLDWLRSVLRREERPTPASDAGDATVLVMHHPPLHVPSRLFTALGLVTAYGFEQDLAAAWESGAPTRVDAVPERVDAVLSGHLHYGATGSVAGVPVFVAPGITNVVDPATASEDVERETALSLSGFQVIEVGRRASAAHPTVLPNRGETREPGPGGGADSPVYEFAAPTITAIMEAAGRKE